MKKQINKNYFTFFKLIIIFFLIFAISCQKQTNPITNPTKPVVPTSPTGSDIIYTDVNPDSVILDSNSRRKYDLDLNNDGIVDFIFTETGKPATGCRVATGITYTAGVKPASRSNNAIMYDGAVPRPLDSLTVIDKNAYWTSDTTNQWLYSNTIGQAAKCDPPGGPWNYTFPANQYLGLKFIKDGNIYYAWARISKGIDQTSLILKGYAYDGIPNQRILAGQTK